VVRRDNIRAGLLRRVGALFVPFAVAGLATFAAPALPIQVGRSVPVASGEVRVVVDGETVVELPFAASHVALHWPGNEEAALTVAFSHDGRTFGPETGVQHDEVDDKEASPETYGGVLFADGARFARVSSERLLEDVTIVALDSHEEVGVADPPSSSALAATGQPPIITRAEWGANESLRFTSQGLEMWPRVFEPVQKIVIHHSAGSNYDPNPAATVRAIMHLDAITKGWSDMGYNFLIDNVGHIYEGRYSRAYAPGEIPTGEDEAGRLVTGAHARHFNSGIAGIVLLGNYVDRDITPATRAALVSLVAWLAERHGLDPLGAGLYVNPITGEGKWLPNIIGHRNVSQTACPGGVFYGTLPSVRQAVAARIAATTGTGVDATDPSVVALQPTSPSPTNSHSASFGIVFSEPVTDLTLSDLSLTGTSTGWTLTSLTGTASVWHVTLHADTPTDGSVQVTLAEDAVADLAGLLGPTSAVASAAIDWDADLAGTVTRIAGADRYDTAASISAATFAPGVPVAYVATGASAADSLAGSVAAALAPGPLLLVPAGSVPASVATELTRLNPGQIVILGGNGVVWPGVVGLLDAYTAGPVTRIAGADRYATAAAISAATFAPGVPVAYIATGRSYADALAGSVAAALAPGPMLLVPGDWVPTTVVNELSRLQPGRIVILGGAGVVSDSIVPTLDAYTAGTVTRIAGADRYETAAAISASTFAPDVPVVYVATGASYADALAGSVAAALGPGPLLLVPGGSSLPPAVAAELSRLSPGRIVILGGVGVMSAGLATTLQGYVAP
jgi:putative cell wall-binding protein